MARFGQVFSRGPKTYVKWPSGKTAKGRTRYKTRAVSSKAKGLKFLEELRKADMRGLLPEAPQSVGMTVVEAVERYIDAKEAEGRTHGTLLGYRTSLRAYRESGLGCIAIDKLTDDDVLAFMRWRQTNTWKTVNGIGVKIKGGKTSNAVLKRDRSLLSSVCARLVRAGKLERNQVSLVAQPKVAEKARRPLRDDEIRRLIAAAHPTLMPPVIAGLFLGARGSEIVALRWRDVDTTGRTVTIFREQGKVGQTLPMNPMLCAMFQEHRERRAEETGRIPPQDEHCFYSRLGQPFRKFPRRAFAGAIERAGLSGRELKPHSLRDTLATAWTGAERDLQQVLGHQHLDTTLRYRRSLDGLGPRLSRNFVGPRDTVGVWKACWPIHPFFSLLCVAHVPARPLHIRSACDFFCRR